VKIYGIRRRDGKVEFGIGNEKPPILHWAEAKEFFDEWVKDHRRSFGSPLYSYEIYERGEGLDFVLMYSSWILDAS
jgi:hypothetical protein